MFRSPEESQAWATFLASQCPNLSTTKSQHLQKNLDVASRAADAMLEEWRKRQPGAKTCEAQSEEAPATESSEPTSEEAAPAEKPKVQQRGGRRKKKDEEPSTEEAPAGEADEGETYR